MTGRLHKITTHARNRIFERLAAEIAREPGIVFAYVYGSVLERDMVHDIDLGVYLGPTSPAKGEDLALALSERLGRLIGIPVDVRILNSAPDSFLYHVLRGTLIHCRDEGVLGDVIERAVLRYLDIAPVLRAATKEAFAP